MGRGQLLILAYLTLCAHAMASIGWSIVVLASDGVLYVFERRFGWLVVAVLVSYWEIYLYVVERTCP